MIDVVIIIMLAIYAKWMSLWLSEIVDNQKKIIEKLENKENDN